MTGAEAIIRCLEAEGVTDVFGLPGGAILPLYDAWARYEHTIRHYLVRHEQGAGHMAQGYARATGRVGVAIATSGPGATNLVTPIADAYLDSTPIVCITGQVPTHLIGTDAFQEADIQGITMPIVKHSWLVKDVADLPRAFKEAFHVARSGRPGPVLIDVPKDVQLATFDFTYPRQTDMPGYKPSATRPSQAGHHRGRGDARGRAAGVLHRRRRGHLGRRSGPADQGRRGAADAGRDDADGQGRLPRLAPALPRPARHARLQGRQLGDEPGRPAGRMRRRASTTASPASWTRSRPARR